MLDWLVKPFQKLTFERRLRKMATALAEGYGAGDTYTFGQVRRVARDVGLAEALLPNACAAFCTEEAFCRDVPQGNAEGYAQMREEIAMMLGLPVSFTAAHLRPGKLSESGGSGEGGE